MNTLPSLKKQNRSHYLKISAQHTSPSYASTSQTVCSSLMKNENKSMIFSHKQNQQTYKNSRVQKENKQKSDEKGNSTQYNPLLFIDSIQLENSQTFFTSQLQLKVQYTVTRQLEEDVTWKIIYFGSAYSDLYDQVLCQFETEQKDVVSSYPQKREFKLEVQPPKWNLISQRELLNVTAIIVSASYKTQQFIRVGYYVHYQLPPLSKSQKQVLQLLQNEQQTLEKQDKQKKFSKTKKIRKQTDKQQSHRSQHLNQQQQSKIMKRILDRTIRTIIVDKPRITKFNINWSMKSQQIKPIMKIQQQTNSNHYQIFLQNQHLITEYFQSNDQFRKE